MQLSALAIALISGSVGMIGLLILAGLLFRFVRRHRALRSIKDRGTSAAEKGHLVKHSSYLVPNQHFDLASSLAYAQEYIHKGDPFLVSNKQKDNTLSNELLFSNFGSPRSSISSPPSAHHAQRKSRSTEFGSTDKVLKVSLPTLTLTSVKRESGVVSSPFGIPLSPILPSPNPRTASFNAKVESSIQAALSYKNTSTTSPGLSPRILTVCATFTPTRDDEMHIFIGERMRLIETFVDQWCLVQRIGLGDKLELGVIPTFCLAESFHVASETLGRRSPNPPPHVYSASR